MNQALGNILMTDGCFNWVTSHVKVNLVVVNKVSSIKSV